MAGQGADPRQQRQVPTPAESRAAANASSRKEPPRPATDRLITGVLVRHGAERYPFDPRGEPSYFITVRTERGERTLWGRGLERALVESRTQPKPGDAIGIRENGIDPMTFISRERNDDGGVRTIARIEKPRPHWIVERREFFNERAAAAKALRDPRASRHETVRNHPELEGAYWALDSAMKIASERIADRGSRERFVALVREALAHTAERGEPLPAAPSSTRSPPRVARSREDEPAR